MQEERDFFENEEKSSSPAPVRRFKKKWFALGAVMLLFVAALISALVIFSKPEVRIAYSLNKAVNDLSKRSEIEPLLDLLESGSIEASVKGDNLSASGKIYINLDDLRAYAKDINLKIDNNSYSAEAYIGLDSAYASSNTLLNGSYGTTAGSAQEYFQDFWGSNEKWEAYYIISGILGLYDEERVPEFLEDYAEISKKNTKVKLELMLNYGELSEEKVQKTIGNKKMKVRVYRLVVDDDALELINTRYLEHLETDKDLRKFLLKYESLLVNLAGKDAGTKGIIDIFETYIDEEKESASQNKSYTKKYVYTLTTKALTAELLALKITETYLWEDYDPSEYTYSIESDEHGLRKAEKLKFCFANMNVEYKIEENTKQNFAVKVTATDKWGSYEGNLDWNKDTENFSLSIFEDKEEFISAKGQISLSKNSDTIRITQFKCYDEEVTLTGEITFCRGDEMPEPTTDFLKSINSLKIDELEDKLETMLEGFFEKLWENNLDF